MTKLSDTNGRCYSLAMASGCDLLIVNPTTLEIQETIPFKNTIKILSSFGPNTLFVFLKNYSWFIINIPNIKRYGEIIPYSTVVGSRKILPRNSPYDLKSICTTVKETQSIRFKENQFAYASHPQFMVVSILSGLLHVIPTRGEPFEIPIRLHNIVDLAFFGPTRSATRLAILADTDMDHRTLVVGRLTRNSFEEEFSELLPPDAYSIIPLHPENASTVVVLTNDGIHRITAPIEIPQIHEHLPTFVSTVSISNTPFEDDKYLLLDANGGICAAEFPLEGRPRVEFLTKTDSIGGTIIYEGNHLIVSSPFGDTISYSFTVGERGVKIEEQARLKACGPIRKLEGNDQLYFLADRICALQVSIECQKVLSMNVGPCLGIFSNKDLVCISYLTESKLIRLFNKKVIKANEEYFVENEGTLAFGEFGDETAQISKSTISILGKKTIKLPFVAESASIFSNLILATEKNVLHIYDEDLNETNITVEKSITMVSSDEKIIAVLAHRDLFVFDRSNLEQIYKYKISKNFTPSSIAVKSSIVYVGTDNGRLLEISNSETAKISEVGSSAVNLHSSSNYIIGSGNPPFVIFNSHFLIGHSEYIDIVLVSNAFVGLLPGGTIEVLEEQERVGGPSKSVTSPPLTNFCVIGNTFIYQDSPTSLQKVHNDQMVNEFQTDAQIVFMQKLIIDDIIVVGLSNNSIILFDNDLTKRFTAKSNAIPLCATEVNKKIAVANTETIEVFEYSKSELEKRVVISVNTLATSLCAVGEYLVVGDRDGTVTVYNIFDDSAEEVSSNSTGFGISKMAALGNLIFVADFDGNVQIFEIDSSLTLIGRIALDSRITSMSTFNNKVVYGTEAGGIGSFIIVEDETFGNQLKVFSKMIDEEGLCFISDRIAEGYETLLQEKIIDIDNIYAACTVPDLAKKIGIDQSKIKSLLDQ